MNTLGLVVATVIVGGLIGALLSTFHKRPGDFFCTIDGAPSFIVEGADDTHRRGDLWTIETEAVTYWFRQRPGEVCSLERAP